MTDVATPEYTGLEADAIGVTEDTAIGMPLRRRPHRPA
jgi:hypothetical protein